MQYVAFVYKNAKEPTTKEEWSDFFERAGSSGMFRGGVGFGVSYKIGDFDIDDLTDSISGFLRFETDNFDELFELVRTHPVAVKGGSLYLCETPKIALEQRNDEGEDIVLIEN